MANPRVFDTDLFDCVPDTASSRWLANWTLYTGVISEYVEQLPSTTPLRRIATPACSRRAYRAAA